MGCELFSICFLGLKLASRSRAVHHGSMPPPQLKVKLLQLRNSNSTLLREFRCHIYFFKAWRYFNFHLQCHKNFLLVEKIPYFSFPL